MGNELHAGTTFVDITHSGHAWLSGPRLWGSALTLLGMTGCDTGCQLTSSPEDLAAMCKALIDLEKAGGAKAPPDCYNVAPPTGVAPVEFGGVTAQVPFSVRDSLAIAGGDIILGPASQFMGAARGSVIASADQRWPGGRVPYDIIGFAEDDLGALEQAMRDWEAVASVAFVPRASDDLAYLRIIEITADGITAGRSYVGLQPADIQPQPLELVKPVSLGTARHELGHALGMWHEHQRPDRDAYIKLLPDNSVMSADQFKVNYDPIDVTLALWTNDYDIHSVMHYSSINGASRANSSGNFLPVLTAADGSIIDNSDKITHLDACAVNMAYDPDRYRRECSVDEDASHCSDRVDILSWSCQGPSRDQECAHVFGATELTAWGDNFICGDPRVIQDIWFRVDGGSRSGNCVSMANHLDPHGWENSELCIRPALRGLEMQDSYVQGKSCIRIYEPNDAIVAWNDRYLCWECPTEDPDITISIQSGGRTATAGTCKTRVDWVVPTDAVVKLSATAKSISGIGIAGMTLSGGGSIHCGGVGEVAVPPTLRNIEVRVFSSQPETAQSELSASGELRIADFIRDCDHPRLSLGLTLTAERVDGTTNTEELSIYSPIR